MTDVDQGDDTPHPFDSPVISWDVPIPLCECGCTLGAHNLDRAKKPCSCGCPSWRPSGLGEQTGRTVRVVAL